MCDRRPTDTLRRLSLASLAEQGQHRRRRGAPVVDLPRRALGMGTRRRARRRRGRRGQPSRAAPGRGGRARGDAHPAVGGAHRARHRHRTDRRRRRADVLLRPQLRCGRSRERCCCRRCSPRPSWSSATPTCGSGCGGRRGCRCTVTSTRPPPWCSPRRPPTRSVTGAGGLPAGPADIAGALGVVAAVLAYVVVNTVLIAVAIGLSRHTTAARELVGRWDDNALEIATLCLGALAAVALGAGPVPRRRSRCRRSSCCTARCGCATWRRPRALDGKTGPAQRGHLAGPRRPRGRGRAPGAAPAVRAHRPRPLQGGQRRARPPRGRRRAGGRWPRACAPACATRTSSAGSAGRSSWCSSGRCPAGLPGGVELAAVGGTAASQVARPQRAGVGRRRDRRALGVGGRGVRRPAGGRRASTGRSARPTPACTRPSAAAATGYASRATSREMLGASGARATRRGRRSAPSHERGRRRSVSWSA